MCVFVCVCDWVCFCLCVCVRVCVCVSLSLSLSASVCCCLTRVQVFGVQRAGAKKVNARTVRLQPPVILRVLKERTQVSGTMVNDA